MGINGEFFLKFLEPFFGGLVAFFKAIGADKEKILEVYKNNTEFNKENSKLDLYGGGKASENIIKELL